MNLIPFVLLRDHRRIDEEIELVDDDDEGQIVVHSAGSINKAIDFCSGWSSCSASLYLDDLKSRHSL